MISSLIVDPIASPNTNSFSSMNSVYWIFKKIWIVISKLQKLRMDALSVSPPGKYKVMKAKFGSSAGFHG